MSAPIQRLRDLSPQQWRSGSAAWLGWMFDGLDMHLYTIVAAPFVAKLLGGLAVTDALVREKSSWIQAAFLLGFALGGAFFGRIGDRLGRSRALSYTILVYALFTGLAFFAQTWWQLLIFRFVAALGIGGEWAVGASLLSETWPARWRPWIAATLQTGVNIGVLIACGVVYVCSLLLQPESSGAASSQYPQIVFLAGIVPALLVFWIRKKVTEPDEWLQAQAAARQQPPGIGALFHRDSIRLTLLCIGVCACTLTAWWSFMFWCNQHLRNLPDVAAWTPRMKEQLVSYAFFVVIGVSVLGNYAGAWMAKIWGYRRAISAMCLGFFLAMFGCFCVERDYLSLIRWYGAVGFFSGVLGLFTMYLPPLFPTLLRTTGAGFCYNIGRIAAAAGTIYFGLFSKVGDFRTTLLYASFLFLPPIFLVLLMDEPPADEPAVVEAAPAE
jgi:MFS family permease